MVLRYATGRGREVHWMLLVSAALFVLYFAIDPIQAAMGAKPVAARYPSVRAVWRSIVRSRASAETGAATRSTVSPDVTTIRPM